MKNGEMIDMTGTMHKVWKYLTENVGDEGKFVSYSDIKKAVGKRSRHAIAYAVEKLRRYGKVQIYDGKLHVLEPYEEGITFAI